MHSDLALPPQREVALSVGLGALEDVTSPPREQMDVIEKVEIRPIGQCKANASETANR